MEKKERIIVVLLILTIAFSLISVIVNLSNNNVNKEFNFKEKNRDSLNNGGNVQLIVESNINNQDVK